MIHKSNSTEVCDQSMRTFRFHLDYTSRKSTRLHAHNVFLAGRMYIGQLLTHLKRAVESGCRWLTDDALHGFERRKETCETHIVTSLPNSGNFVSRLKASHLRRLKWDLKISSWRKLKLFLYFLPFSFPLYLFFCTSTTTKKNNNNNNTKQNIMINLPLLFIRAIWVKLSKSVWVAFQQKCHFLRDSATKYLQPDSQHQPVYHRYHHGV